MFQLKQVACAYEQKKVFTGLDLEIRQGQYGGKWDREIKSYQFINWLQAGRIWSHSFLREGPQRMAEGQTSKTRFL